MNDFYTYAYLREDRTPYYIGKGKHKHKTNQKYYRAYCGQHWIPIPPKERIIILKDDICENDAFKHEIYMISVFGRKNLGTGILLNLTNGGEGFSGFKLSEKRKSDISKRMKKYLEENPNPNLKKYLLINVSGEYYIVDDGLMKFCKNKNISYSGLDKRIDRGMNTPTKCGWYYFNVVDKTEKEISIIRNNFLIKYENRSNKFNIKIETINGKVSIKSVYIVFNFIFNKINGEPKNLIQHNGNEYLKIKDFKSCDLSRKTITRAIKTLEENNIIKIERLNKNNLDQTNYYSVLSL